MSTATGPISTAPTPSGSTEVSNTRLYLGNLPRTGMLRTSYASSQFSPARLDRHAFTTANLTATVTKTDIENHFNKHGTGDILEIKLMNGFGFIEYKDAMDARDVVPAFLQFARGARNTRDGGSGGGNGNTSQERPPPRPRRTAHRMGVTGLPNDTSWQDLKDFARRSGLDVVYSETSRSGDGSVEFETAQDLATAIEKLNNTEFRDKVVTCTAIYRDRGRSRSPRRPYPPPRDDYDRRGPPPPRGGYSPRRDGPGYRDNYRDRSPRRDYYDDRMRYASPSRRPPMEDYPPPQRRYDDPYRRDYPPPDPYANRGPYDRPPPPRDFPPRDAGYPRDNGYPPRDYDRRYW
ncbi:pre-mRNA splicing factor [Sporothrix brasiliensis 5110]|uniref:Pre-mRNA splicing factor n=1 Tax=Sporothrix brasiliensis 5110 TaxID=1398154 RepID=A0A0C2F893_9PEZI|nr:pre-mRNA splicing factor [Sporothrix brasiliensis 5110]KIH87248.1 pre-mRNA splicing factor [Sporothrix brasiliensis 5110]